MLNVGELLVALLTAGLLLNAALSAVAARLVILLVSAMDANQA
jgi:hypothetical protein